MSQEQQRRGGQEEPIKYGDVFNVSGDLADTPITRRDASTVQAAESAVLGKTQKGGPASVMQSAAGANVEAGVVAAYDGGGGSDAAREKGVAFSQTEDRGNRVVTEFIGGQVVGQFVTPAAAPPASVPSSDAITIGEALEAAALSAGDKEVDRSDVAAIQAAEAKATMAGGTVPGGVAAAAQVAAAKNERTLNEFGKITLSDILTDATEKLPRDKPVTGEVAEGAIGAELRNKPDMKTTPGGVAESLAAAARLNQSA